MSTNTISRNASKRAGWSILMGLLTVAAGVVMVLHPGATAAVSTAFLGWALMFAAVAQVVFAFTSATPRGFFLKLMLGIAYGLAGIALAVFPGAGVVTLTGVIGTMLIVEAILEAAIAVSFPEGRAWYAASSFASLVLGVVILVAWPGSSAWAIGTLLGIGLMSNGVARIAASVAVYDGVQAIDRPANVA